MIISAVRSILRYLLTLDDGQWVAFRRGLLMVVKGDTPAQSRKGIGMMLAALEQQDALRARRSA